MSAALPTSPFEVSSLLHSGYHHPTLRTWQASAGGLSHITKPSLVFPIFIHDLPDVKEPIATLPGQFRRGWLTVLLFGVPTSIEKDARGSAADDENGPVIQAIRLFRKEFPSVLVACDLCLCAYTSHGHCGTLHADGSIDNHPSIDRLAEVALNYTKAGC
ncbi:hypothetical protein BASA50_007154 [Batrachochytrium salamandrivorans]|uniref:porphobilinogen synthase n=1 Tax=Batrachochytrium salamandrivorans TaxID=1357716 RepID=A0ABQ8F7U6_9FUNG|nr:hypothetical protein BASA50_007154 [Batrachochytrium salamandrivorans]